MVPRTLLRLLRSPLLIAVGLVLLAAAPPVLADLRGSTLHSLLHDSHWIVLARVESVTPGAHGAGQARLLPLETVRGTATTEPFTLGWSDEVHDQRVPPPPATVLLFLARRDGVLGPAQYGRSLWPVQTGPLAASRCTRYTLHRYPLTLLQLDASQQQSLLQRAGSPPQPILCLDDWAALISTHPPRTPR